MQILKKDTKQLAIASPTAREQIRPDENWIIFHVNFWQNTQNGRKHAKRNINLMKNLSTFEPSRSLGRLATDKWSESNPITKTLQCQCSVSLQHDKMPAELQQEMPLRSLIYVISVFPCVMLIHVN